MNQPKFKVGDEVFTREPKRYIPDARAIIGTIAKVTPIGSSFKYDIDAGDVTIETGPGHFDFIRRHVGTVSIFEIDLGFLVGTPASQLLLGNGRVTDRFVEIANSWGYP